MKAGALDRRVSLQHRGLTRDAVTGEEVVSYSEYAQVWAGKRDLRGREFFSAQQLNADTSTVWQMRYRSDVLSTDRLVYGSMAYNISQISEIGRKHGLEISGSAVTP